MLRPDLERPHARFGRCGGGPLFRSCPGTPAWMVAAAATCQFRWTNDMDECFDDGLPVSGLLPPEPPSYETVARQVARVPAAELTVESLYHDFARPGLPVVIDGALGLNTTWWAKKQAALHRCCAEEYAAGHSAHGGVSPSDCNPYTDWCSSGVLVCKSCRRLAGIPAGNAPSIFARLFGELPRPLPPLDSFTAPSRGRGAFVWYSSPGDTFGSNVRGHSASTENAGERVPEEDPAPASGCACSVAASGALASQPLPSKYTLRRSTSIKHAAPLSRRSTLARSDGLCGRHGTCLPPTAAPPFPRTRASRRPCGRATC